MTGAAVATLARRDDAGAGASTASLGMLVEGHPGQAAALHEWRSGSAGLIGTVPTSVLLLLSERHEAALTVVDTVLAEATSRRASLGLPFYLGLRSEISFWTGDWASAHASASEALCLAEERGQPAMLAFAAACLARIEAGRGDERACRTYAELAGAAVSAGGDHLQGQAVEAVALLLLGHGRPAEAAAVGGDLVRPPSVRAGADLVEALVHSDQRHAAESTLDAVAVGVDRTGQSWARAAVRRCRGLLAGGDAAEAHFRAALELHRTTNTPFETARTELCLGEWLRRNRRPRDASEALRTALTTFEHLGAAPWAERARSELRATGDHRREGRRQRCAAGDTTLTPQEERVAMAIAAGASNKEAAAALFLSAKTVEFHLSSVYRKLGISSRSQLARQFALAS